MALLSGGGGGGALTLRTRRPISPHALPAAPPAAEPRAWRVDKDDGGGLVTRMRTSLWSLATAPPPCRLRELVCELAPPRARAPAHPLAADDAARDACARLCGRLNGEQRSCVAAVLASADYALMRGLPGTGKTATLCACVGALVERGARVLLVAPTHAAVDTALQRLLDAGLPGVCRVGGCGSGREAHPGLACVTLGACAAWPADRGLSLARVVGCTCHAAAVGGFSPLGGATFDVCVVDEAAQLPLPLALGPLRRAAAALLVGDPAQLPPLWASKRAREAGGEESLFSRLAAAHPRAVTLLRRQYRMAADVMALANALCYGGALAVGDAATARRRLDLPLLPALPSPPHPAWARAALHPDARVVLLDTDGVPDCCARPAPLRNPGEAALVAALAAAALAAGLGGRHLAVLSPYNAQVDLVGRALAAASLPPGWAEATTVDRSQGRDLPFVILCAVCTAGAAQPLAAQPLPQQHDAAAPLLADPRRLCVALTRAQSKMVIVASCAALRSGGPATRALADACDARGWTHRLPADALRAPAAAAALACLGAAA